MGAESRHKDPLSNLSPGPGFAILLFQGDFNFLQVRHCASQSMETETKWLWLVLAPDQIIRNMLCHGVANITALSFIV